MVGATVKLKLSRGAWPLVLAIVGFGLGMAGMRLGRSLTVQKRAAGDTPGSRSEVERRGGDQLMLVYIGRASCAWCRHPDTHTHLATIHHRLAALADSAGWEYSAVGIALDRDAEAGLEHLKTFNVFSAVASGGGWVGLFGSRLLWEQFPGTAATPQVVVLRRRVVRDGGGSSEIVFSVEDERLLARKVGLVEIGGWAQKGMVLPRTGLSAGM